MNKAKAKKMAYENKTTTYGDLIKILNEADTSKLCKLNPCLTRQQCVDIMMGGLIDKDLSAVVRTTRYHIRKDDLTLSGDGINMMNILAEFVR